MLVLKIFCADYWANTT